MQALSPEVTEVVTTLKTTSEVQLFKGVKPRDKSAICEKEMLEYGGTVEGKTTEKVGSGGGFVAETGIVIRCVIPPPTAVTVAVPATAAAALTVKFAPDVRAAQVIPVDPAHEYDREARLKVPVAPAVTLNPRELPA
jgi:hypothetical protein